MCLPNHLPPNIAKLSHTQVDRHARMSVNAHMRLTLITIIAPNRTQGIGEPREREKRTLAGDFFVYHAGEKRKIYAEHKQHTVCEHARVKHCVHILQYYKRA